MAWLEEDPQSGAGARLEGSVPGLTTGLNHRVRPRASPAGPTHQSSLSGVEARLNSEVYLVSGGARLNTGTDLNSGGARLKLKDTNNVEARLNP